ncbi:MAG: hypothetical protein KF784_01525 [Fimbriimonadaceae bacterium]|nr:hypothetical protein [Fimbriimonadaceae bacterium]
MRIKSFIAGFIVASALVAVAYAQTQSQSSSSSSKQSSSSSSASKQSSSSASARSGGSHLAGSSSSGSGNMRSIPYPTHAVIYSPGKNWDTSKSVMEQTLIQEHIAYWQRVISTGKFFLGGPWRNEPGGMNLLVTKSDEEAESLVMGDPAVKGGLLVPDIKAWYIGLDGTLAASQLAGK